MTHCARLLCWPLLSLALLACSSAPPLRPPATSRAVVHAAPVAAPTPAQPDDQAAQARFHAALQLMQNQQIDEATAALESLSRDYPQFSGPATNLGILYSRRNQLVLARSWFERAVQNNPSNVVALSWLGATRRALRDYNGAEDAYRRALSVQPDYAPAHLDLGILYEVWLRRAPDALREYREYIRCAAAHNLLVDAWIRKLEAAPTSTAVAQRE